MLNTSLAFMLAQAATTAPVTPPALPSPTCVSAAHGAFDFWVGEWDVYPRGAEQLVAHSRIERLYAGCAIRENWMPLQGAGGGSLNTLDPATGRWSQYWVDSQGGRVSFTGGPVGGKMVLTGFWRGVNGPGQDGLIRMTYSTLDKDTVRQHGEISTDQGLSWTTSFDFVYRRAKPAGD